MQGRHILPWVHHHPVLGEHARGPGLAQYGWPAPQTAHGSAQSSWRGRPDLVGSMLSVANQRLANGDDSIVPASTSRNDPVVGQVDGSGAQRSLCLA